MNYKNILILLAVACLSAIPLQMAAQGATRDPLRATSSAFFPTDEARHIGDQMLLMKHEADFDVIVQPDPWGLRAFYFNCTREGGNSGWLKNNLNQMEKPPAPHEITACWTFRGQWDPEARIRELWDVLAY